MAVEVLVAWAVAVAGDVAASTDEVVAGAGAGAAEATDMAAAAHLAMGDMDSLASTEILLQKPNI